jgi:predicted ATP-dependent endonuclease of OLD family
MKIRAVRIRNFRSFADEEIDFDSHSCLLGPNGAGKSTVLSALNVFFQEPSSTTDVAGLLQMIVFGQELEIPLYVVFDSDGHITKAEHRRNGGSIVLRPESTLPVPKASLAPRA